MCLIGLGMLVLSGQACCEGGASFRVKYFSKGVWFEMCFGSYKG